MGNYGFMDLVRLVLDPEICRMRPLGPVIVLALLPSQKWMEFLFVMQVLFVAQIKLNGLI